MRDRFDAVREQIALNDEAIVAAVNRRLDLVAELWQLKQELGLDTVDPGRELLLRERLAAASKGSALAGRPRPAGDGAARSDQARARRRAVART